MNEFEDETLWQVLRQTNLFEKVEQLKEKLNTDITHSRTVFSVGET